MSKKINTDECMLWARGCNSQGYGSWTSLINGSRKRAHRVMYECFIGEIPNGMTIDHLCKCPSCINVEHMEVVTIQENISRSGGVSSINKSKIVCKRGHPLSGNNLYVYKNMRKCKTCMRDYGKSWEKEHRFYSNGVRYSNAA